MTRSHLLLSAALVLLAAFPCLAADAPAAPPADAVPPAATDPLQVELPESQPPAAADLPASLEQKIGSLMPKPVAAACPHNDPCFFGECLDYPDCPPPTCVNDRCRYQ